MKAVNHRACQGGALHRLCIFQPAGVELLRMLSGYNGPPEWADWATELQAIKKETGIVVPQDNKNSGQALAQLVAEKDNPALPTWCITASALSRRLRQAAIAADYKPANWDQVPAGMKDPEGSGLRGPGGTMGFMVNVDALGGAPIPTSWDDLTKPRYKGMVGDLDPASAFVRLRGRRGGEPGKGGSMRDSATAALV
ncbi:extracellular solute-binding protein [Pantoea ananatis]